jgi:adenosylmethionine-8-amino-7-oxononanoate aminotransferase
LGGISKIVGEVRGTGLVAGIDFIADKKARVPLTVDHLINMIKFAVKPAKIN